VVKQNDAKSYWFGNGGVFMVFAILGAIAILAQSSEVWSDGYVELTLNKIYRTDTVPPDFERVSSPKVGHDFVVINLTFTHIEGREVVAGGSPVLFDSEGNNYTVGKMVAGISGLQFAVKEGKQVVYELISEGARELLLYPMPKDREPAHLEFSYLYAESWETTSNTNSNAYTCTYCITSSNANVFTNSHSSSNTYTDTAEEGSGIWSDIRNRRIISNSISFEEVEMKQQGCLGIYSGCG
jgi:hypothetical protein